MKISLRVEQMIADFADKQYICEILRSICVHLREMCLLFGLFFFSNLLFASNWQVSLKNRQYLFHNTSLYLTETTGALQGKTVSINIRMHEQGQPFFPFQKNMNWLISFQPVSLSYFRFSKGNYEVLIDIYCPETGETTSLKYDYECVPIENGVYASDIFLDYNPIRFLGEKAPILTEILADKKQNLYFYQEVTAQKSILTARAILYKEKKTQSNAKATTYSSLSQVNQILSMQNGTGYFTGNFDLSQLPANKYLIEILIYADAQLLSEKSTRFEISQEEAFLRPENIDKSIEDLALLCTKQEIDKVKALPNKGEKKRALLRVFEQRYPNEGLLQAQAYFAKIQGAHQRFATENNFWQSPRVQTFLRYGEPNQMEMMVLQGKEFQKWQYEKWNLLVIFEKKGGIWVKM